MSTVNRDTARVDSSEPPAASWQDHQDFADAERGLLGRGEERQIRADDGRVVWDLDAYSFLETPCPDTANPSLWRQGSC